MPPRDFRSRALAFASEILALNRRLRAHKDRFGGVLNQLMRSGTGMGANIEEAQVAYSRREMAAKYAIALREAREALYWLELLATDPMIGDSVAPLIKEANEWVAMLTTTVRKLRS